MSHEESVQYLVDNEWTVTLKIAKDAAKKVEKSYAAVREKALALVNKDYMDDADDNYNGNMTLFEICQEDEDLQELKRLTVVFELFHIRINYLERLIGSTEASKTISKQNSQGDVSSIQ